MKRLGIIICAMMVWCSTGPSKATDRTDLTVGPIGTVSSDLAWFCAENNLKCVYLYFTCPPDGKQTLGVAYQEANGTWTVISAADGKVITGIKDVNEFDTSDLLGKPCDYWVHEAPLMNPDHPKLCEVKSTTLTTCTFCCGDQYVACLNATPREQHDRCKTVNESCQAHCKNSFQDPVQPKRCASAYNTTYHCTLCCNQYAGLGDPWVSECRQGCNDAGFTVQAPIPNNCRVAGAGVGLQHYYTCRSCCRPKAGPPTCRHPQDPVCAEWYRMCERTCEIFHLSPR